MASRDPCSVCGAPSVAWCDGILLGESGKPLGIETGRLQWCRVPLCDAHRRTVGRFGSGNSIDHCPDCFAVDGRRRVVDVPTPAPAGSLF